MTRQRLKVIRWTLVLASLALAVTSWVFNPTEGVALLLFGALIVTGIPAAMLSLHLSQPDEPKA